MGIYEAYEREMVGTVKFVFTNEKFVDTELVFWVHYDNTEDDGDIENRAWGLLQDLLPDEGWLGWRVLERIEN